MVYPNCTRSDVVTSFLGWFLATYVHFLGLGSTSFDRVLCYLSFSCVLLLCCLLPICFTWPFSVTSFVAFVASGFFFLVFFEIYLLLLLLLKLLMLLLLLLLLPLLVLLLPQYLSA